MENNSTYYENDINKLNIVNQESTRSVYVGDNSYSINITGEVYENILEIYKKVLDDLKLNKKFAKSNMITGELRTYYESLNQGNDIEKIIDDLILEFEDIILKIETSINVYEEIDTEMLGFLNSIIGEVFTTDTTTVELKDKSLEERRLYLSQTIEKTETVLKKLQEAYNELCGEEVTFDEEKVDEFVHLFDSLSLFGDVYTGGNVFTNEYGVTVDANKLYNNVTGAFDFKQLACMIECINKTDLMPSLKNYFQKGQSWEESGLQELCGEKLEAIYLHQKNNLGMHQSSVDLTGDAEAIFLRNYINGFYNSDYATENEFAEFVGYYDAYYSDLAWNGDKYKGVANYFTGDGVSILSDEDEMNFEKYWKEHASDKDWYIQNSYHLTDEIANYFGINSGVPFTTTVGDLNSDVSIKEVASRFVKKYVYHSDVFSTIDTLSTTYEEKTGEYGGLFNLEKDVVGLSNTIYNYKQYYKLMPFDVEKKNATYLTKYANQNYDTSYKNEVLPNDWLQYLDRSEVALLDYLYNEKSKDEAKEYIDAMSDIVNQRKGYREAVKFAESLNTEYRFEETGSMLGVMATGNPVLIAGTVAYSLINKFFPEFHDTVVDTGISATEGFIDGNYNFLDGFYDLINADGVKSAKDYELMYKMQLLASDNEYTKNLSNEEKEWLSSVYQFGNSLGYMTIPTLLSYVPLAGNALSFTALTASSSGNSTEDLMQQGVEKERAYMYGSLMGLSESVVEKLIGGLPGGADNAGKGLLGLVKSSFGEAGEEAFQTYISAGISSMATGEPIDFLATTNEAYEAGLMAIFTSGAMNTGGSVFIKVADTIIETTPSKFNNYQEWRASIENDFRNNNSDVANILMGTPQESTELILNIDREELNNIDATQRQMISGLTYDTKTGEYQVTLINGNTFNVDNLDKVNGNVLISNLTKEKPSNEGLVQKIKDFFAKKNSENDTQMVTEGISSAIKRLQSFYSDNLEFISDHLKSDMSQAEKGKLIKDIYERIFENNKDIKFDTASDLKIYRGISAKDKSMLKQYVSEFVNGKMHFGTRASIYGTGVYICSEDSKDVAKNYATDGYTNTNGAVVECAISSEAKVGIYEEIIENKEKILSQLKENSNNENHQIYAEMLDDNGLYASILGYDAIYVKEKDYFVVFNGNTLKATNIEFCNENGEFDNSVSPNEYMKENVSDDVIIETPENVTETPKEVVKPTLENANANKQDMSPIAFEEEVTPSVPENIEAQPETVTPTIQKGQTVNKEFNQVAFDIDAPTDSVIIEPTVNVTETQNVTTDTVTSNVGFKATTVDSEVSPIMQEVAVAGDKKTFDLSTSLIKHINNSIKKANEVVTLSDGTIAPISFDCKYSEFQGPNEKGKYGIFGDLMNTTLNIGDTPVVNYSVMFRRRSEDSPSYSEVEIEYYNNFYNTNNSNYLNKGYTKYGLQKIVESLFEQNVTPEIFLAINNDNAASIKVATNSGFVKTSENSYSSSYTIFHPHAVELYENAIQPFKNSENTELYDKLLGDFKKRYNEFNQIAFDSNATTDSVIIEPTVNVTENQNVTTDTVTSNVGFKATAVDSEVSPITQEVGLKEVTPSVTENIEAHPETVAPTIQKGSTTNNQFKQVAFDSEVADSVIIEPTVNNTKTSETQDMVVEQPTVNNNIPSNPNTTSTNTTKEDIHETSPNVASNKNLWDTNVGKKMVYLKTIEDVIEAIKNGKISGDFEVKDGYDSFNDKPSSYLEEIFGKKNMRVNYTDENHQVIYYDSNIAITPSIFSTSFFQQYKSQIVEAISENILKSDNITINKNTFSDELFNKIVEREEITVYFDDVTLTQEQIQKLQEKFIDAYVDGKQVSSKYALQYYTRDDLSKQSSFSLNYDELSSVNIDGFNYLPDNCNVKFSSYDSKLSIEERYKILNEFLIKLNTLNKPFKIDIDIDKRSLIEKSGILNSNFENLELSFKELGDIEYTLDEYLEEDRRLNELVKDIKDADLTPYEKYIAVYNIVKNYKPYKENSDNLSDSRFLKYLLDNEYMVCVGYSNLLEALLGKVGIDTADLGVRVDISYDGGFTLEDIPVSDAGHARLLVNIDDDKYNIHGIYVADPTWDNNLNKDLLNYSLMTIDQMQTNKRLFWNNNINLMLDVHNFQEFNEHINYIFRKAFNEKVKGYESTGSSPPSNKELILRVYNEIVNEMKDTLQYLDTDKWNEIYSKYKFKTEEDYGDFLTEIGHYIVDKVNKPIDSINPIEANLVGKKELFGLDENQLEELRQQLMETHFKRENNAFPYYLKDDGTIGVKEGSIITTASPSNQVQENSINQEASPENQTAIGKVHVENDAFNQMIADDIVFNDQNLDKIISLENTTTEWQLNNIEIVTNAIRKDGLNLKYVSEKFQNSHPELVMEAVKQNGMLLQYVSQYLKENAPGITFIALKQNADALQFVDSVCLKKYANMLEPALFEAVKYFIDKKEYSFVNKLNKDVLMKIIPYAYENGYYQIPRMVYTDFEVEQLVRKYKNIDLEIERVKSITSWTKTEMLDLIRNYFGDLISNLNITYLAERCIFEDDSNYSGVGSGYCDGFYAHIKINGYTGFVKVNYDNLQNTTLHETLHLLSTYFPTETQYYTGISSQIYNQDTSLFEIKYIALNEAITEFLTSEILKKQDTSCAYLKGVQALKSIIKMNIDGLGVDDIKRAYINNDVSIIKNAIDNVAGKGFFEEKLDPAFELLISSAQDSTKMNKVLLELKMKKLLGRKGK